MRCEVVAIGSELLLGQIVDSNSAWIGEQLALAGVDSHFQVKVGDNQARMVAALRAALGRAEAVICCGGLGPTQDDITRDAVAEVMGAELVRDHGVERRIRDIFAGAQRTMSDNNLRQADVPQGAQVIVQTTGTAPGLICPVGDGVIYAVPGVPAEMRDMVQRAVMPDLVTRAGSPATIRSRTLRTWGLAESSLAECIARRVDALDVTGNPTIAFLASGIEGIKVRITARGSGAEPAAAATALLDAEEAELRALLGTAVFGVDDETMEAAVGGLLIAGSLTLGLAESVTGGLMAGRCTAVPGASTWFRGSVVSYATAVKRDVLAVEAEAVVSEAAAREMAQGARRVLGADVALAVTGVAGPTEADGQPVGTVWIGLADGETTSATHLFGPGNRERVRQMSAISAMDVLRRHLLARTGAQGL
ncbi:MAG: competence/damage-inducible protein A [Actinomycetota bacterium]|nr:competence/damage-inducible protein A [Actinomycetota bacterium]